MKKILSLIFATALLISVFTVPTFVAGASSSDSLATVKLTSGDLVILPPNPDPELPTINGRDMDFGTVKITGTEQVLSTVGNQKVGLIVSDARGEGLSTWRVNVSIGEFGDGSVLNTIKGFTLELRADIGSITGNAISLPPVASTVILSANQLDTIFESEAVAGSAGKWGANWIPTLSIPSGGAIVADHKAVVTWTIESGV